MTEQEAMEVLVAYADEEPAEEEQEEVWSDSKDVSIY